MAVYDLWIWMLLALAQFPQSETGIASRFAYPGDKWVGGTAFCLRDNYGRPRKIRPSDHVVAHRKLPCGTVLAIRNIRTNKWTTATVGDRGPYGACNHPSYRRGRRCPKGHWHIKVKRSDPGIWRGIVDLTPSVSRAIGHNGYEAVEIFILKKGRTRKQRVLRVGT